MGAELTRRARLSLLAALGVVLLAGIFLRLPPSLFFRDGGALRSLAILHPNAKWSELRLIGIDEGLYRDYVTQLGEIGLTRYPQLVSAYIDKQSQSPGAILPPTRALYIFAGAAWHALFGADPLASLREVASIFSMLTLALAAALGWRMFGPGTSLAVTALVAFAPTQIHMSQNAMIDGFFTFWALLALALLWQNLQTPRNWIWLGSYAASLALLVLTKETAFFVWVAIVLLLAANRWLRFGQVSRELIIATFVGPLLGALALVFLVGGPTSLVNAYHLFVAKNYSSDYLIRTMDGPWQRYLVDLLFVSPIVTALAFTAFFRSGPPALRFLAIFLALTYALMCNVPYGLNLRFVNFWDVPLRLLAVFGLSQLLAPLCKRSRIVLPLAIAFICVIELRQYQTLFVEHSLHELTSDGLARALNISK